MALIFSSLKKSGTPTLDSHLYFAIRSRHSFKQYIVHVYDACVCNPVIEFEYVAFLVNDCEEIGQ